MTTIPSDAEIVQKNDSWYFMPDAWNAMQGPYESYVKAHEALIMYLENRGNRDNNYLLRDDQH